METTKKSSIDFLVGVNGNLLTARVREYGESCEGQLEHHVIAFSDGITGKFWFYPSNENIIVDDEALAYAEAIKYDIQLISIAAKATFHHIFQHTINGELRNVWVMPVDPDPGDGESYGVYYNNKYQFELCRAHGESEWTIGIAVSSEIDILDIDEDLAERVGHLLDAVL